MDKEQLKDEELEKVSGGVGGFVDSGFQEKPPIESSERGDHLRGGIFVSFEDDRHKIR